MRRIAGQAVEITDGNAAGSSAGAEHLDLSVQDSHRDSHVGRMGGDTCIARAEDRMYPVDTADRGAARSGLPLVAVRGRVVKVRAARALQQVAADRCLVSQLPRRPGDQCLGEHRVACAHASIAGNLGVGGLGADP